MTHSSDGRDPIGKTSRASRHAGWPVTALRVVILFGAVVLLAYGLAEFADGGRLKPIQYWWLMVVAFAAVPFGLCLGSDWRGAGFVMSTFLVGFGAQLSLKEPEWFQKVLINLESGFCLLALGVIAIQGAAAATILLRRNALRELPRAIAGLGPVRVLAFLAFMIVVSAGAMEAIALSKPEIYIRQLVITLAFTTINVLSFVALAAALPRDGLLALADRVRTTISLNGNDGPKPGDLAFRVALATMIFVLCTIIAYVALEAVPHLDDIIYRFQARYLSHGMIAVPVPPSVEAFDSYLLDSHDGRWFATTLPGWPMAIAIGQILHIELLLNPLLAAAGVLLIHRFAVVVTTRGTATVVALLLAVSPWHLALSSNLLIHTFTLVLILAAWLLLLKSRDSVSYAMPFLAGMLIGWLFLTRPLEGLLIGILTGFWTLALLNSRRNWWAVVFFSLGCIVVSATIFPYNAYLTGDPLKTTLNTYYDWYWGPKSNALGFGPDRGAVPSWGSLDVFEGHSPLEALINAQQNLHELNSSLLGWGGASLAFATIFVLWGRWTRFALGMAGICIATLAAYALYWFYGGYYAGARYYYLMFIPLLFFTAFGIQTSIGLFERLFPGRNTAERLGFGVAFLCLCSVLVFGSWLGFNRYPGIRGNHPDYLELSRQDAFDNALVFINDATDKEYSSAYWLNDFTAGATTPLFARNLGPESNREIAEAYPDRPIYFVEGRQSKRKPVSVVRGPLTLDDLE